jgi:hypothetical protein
MFDADFLANIIVWRWIWNAIFHAVAVVVVVVGFAGYTAWQGEFAPALIVACLGFLVFLIIRNAFRRQARLQAWRDSVLPWSPRSPEGRTEPRLYPAAVTQPAGLRAAPASRWPVSRA